MKETVGFIGLGNMGSPMALNLLKAGYSLQVFNRTSSKAESLLQQGASQAFSSRAIAEQVTVVISMVADDEALEAVALGEEGILAGLALGGIHVDMSTVLPDTSKKLSDLYQERGVHFVAAPVFGTLDMAAAADLRICPAGPAAVIDRCRPLFDAMGQVFIVAGEEPHLANVLKLVGNFFLLSLNETLSEAFTLAEKAGLKSQQVLELVQLILPGPASQGYATRISRHEFSLPNFPIRLALKDAGHMRRLADQVVAPLPLADLGYRHLLAALARGRGELDQTALVTVVREMAGLEAGVDE